MIHPPVDISKPLDYLSAEFFKSKKEVYTFGEISTTTCVSIFLKERISCLFRFILFVVKLPLSFICDMYEIYLKGMEQLGN